MKHYAIEDLLSYLNGGFSAEEVNSFNSHLKECAECRALFDSTIDFEIAMIEAAPNPKERVIPEENLKKMAFIAAQDEVLKQKKILPFITLNKIILSAAAVVLVVLAFNMFRSFVFPSVKNEIAINSVTLEQNNNTDTVACVTVREKPSPKVTKFGKSTIAVPSGSALLRVITKSDDVAIAALDSGSALFSVEPNHYTTFKVETPDAEISVIGTVFDVWVERGTTKVTVLQGKVSVKYKTLQRHILLNKEEVVKIDSLRINVSKISSHDTAGLTEYKKLIVAEAVINKIEEAPSSNWGILLNEAAALVNNRSFGEANAVYGRIIEADLRNSIEEIARFESAMLLIKHLNEKDAGLQALENYIKLYPNGLFEEESMLELVKVSGIDASKVYDNTIRFISKYSDHPYARRSAYENATKLRESGNYLLAANLYEKFYTLWPRDNRTEDAIYWRAKSAILAGDTSVGSSCMLEYARKYPSGRWIREAEAALSR